MPHVTCILMAESPSTIRRALPADYEPDIVVGPAERATNSWLAVECKLSEVLRFRTTTADWTFSTAEKGLLRDLISVNASFSRRIDETRVFWDFFKELRSYTARLAAEKSLYELELQRALPKWDYRWGLAKRLLSPSDLHLIWRDFVDQISSDHPPVSPRALILSMFASLCAGIARKLVAKIENLGTLCQDGVPDARDLILTHSIITGCSPPTIRVLAQRQLVDRKQERKHKNESRFRSAASGYFGVSLLRQSAEGPRGGRASYRASPVGVPHLGRRHVRGGPNRVERWGICRAADRKVGDRIHLERRGRSRSTSLATNVGK